MARSRKQGGRAQKAMRRGAGKKATRETNARPDAEEKTMMITARVSGVATEWDRVLVAD